MSMFTFLNYYFPIPFTRIYQNWTGNLSLSQRVIYQWAKQTRSWIQLTNHVDDIMLLTVLFIFDSLSGAFSISHKVLYLYLSCVYHTTGGSTPQARTHFPPTFPRLLANSLPLSNAPTFPCWWPTWLIDGNKESTAPIQCC